MARVRTVDEYIASQSPAAQVMLRQIRAMIRAEVPEAEEKLRYGMPFYEYRYSGIRGRPAYFAAYPRHVGYYPLPHSVPAALERELEAYRVGKSTLRFPVGRTIPRDLLVRVIRLRKQQIDAAR